MARPRLISDEQILATMRASVLQHGPRVSLDVVAEQLKVTSPALLKRFGTREELLIAALKPEAEPPWMKALEQPPDDRPFREQLVEHFERVWSFFAEAIPCITALRESGIAHERLFDLKKTGPAQNIRLIARWLERAHEKGLAHVASPETAATAILGALQARAFTSHVSRLHYSARSNRAYLEELAALFDRALQAPPSRARQVTP